MLYLTTASGDTTFEQFADAREVADQHTVENGVEVKVIGRLEDKSELLAYHTSPRIVNGVVQGVFAPWTRIQPVPSTFQPPFISGYTLAYKRDRIQAGVYRPDVKGQPWLIVTASERVQAANTKVACGITREMGQAQLKAKRAAADAAKAAKDEVTTAA